MEYQVNRGKLEQKKQPRPKLKKDGIKELDIVPYVASALILSDRLLSGPIATYPASAWLFRLPVVSSKCFQTRVH